MSSYSYPVGPVVGPDSGPGAAARQPFPGFAPASRRSLLRAVLLLSVLLAAVPNSGAPVAGQAGADTGRVTEAVAGTLGTGDAGRPSISADDRYVAFESLAGNLVPGDTNALEDVFVYDRRTNATERASVATGGAQGTGLSSRPAISGDGRYVAFVSVAKNLVPSDTNGAADVFVRDRQTNTTERASVAGDASQGNADSRRPSISSDGRFVAFASLASNLVTGDTNGTEDVFVRDRQTGATSRVSVGTGGTEANDASYALSISGDGRYVGFESDATNLVAGDTNNAVDTFLHDRQTGASSRVSVTSAGAQAVEDSYSLAVSDDGSFVAFGSLAANLAMDDTNGIEDAFLRDRQTDTTTRLSVATGGAQANNGSFDVSVSGDGRYVAYDSDASNLAGGDTNGGQDVFVRDRQVGETSLVSVTSDGLIGNASSYWPAISTNGRCVAFASNATNLVAGDTNGKRDVFVSCVVHRGDCNNDGPVDAADIARIVLEIFDGDGDGPAATPGGTVRGNPIGCNANQDTEVDAGDLACTVRLLFDSPGGCG